MADFLKTYTELILPNEGGYSNNKNDLGGETYGGIARNYHPDWTGWTYIDSIKKVRKIKWNEKFPALNESVMNFYKARWNKIRLSEFTSQKIADLVFDYYTHSETRAITSLQKLLGVKPDGAVGSITITAANNANEKRLYADYLNERTEFLIQRSKAPGQSDFYEGWMARMDYLKSRAPVAGIAIGIVAIIVLLLWTNG